MRNKRFVAMAVALATLAVMSLGGCSALQRCRLDAPLLAGGI